MRILLLPLILGFATPSFADIIPGSGFESRAWSGAAYAYDNGAFSHCAMSADYESGDTLVLSVNEDASIGIGVVSPRLQIEPSAQYAVSVFVDRRYSSQVVARAVDTQHFVLFLTDFTRALDAIRFGNVMAIQGNGFLGEYNLTGTAVALDLARQCAVAYLDYRGPSNDTDPPAVTSDRVTPEFDRTYLFQAATEVISTLGLVDFRYFTEEEMRETGTSPNTVYWHSESAGIMGGVFLEAREGQSLRQSDPSDTQYLASFCDGDFATSARDLNSFSVPAREVRLICTEDERPHEVFLTKIQIGDLVLYSELRYFEGNNATAQSRSRGTDNEAVATRLASFVLE
jgi:hypothetical protein